MIPICVLPLHFQRNFSYRTGNGLTYDRCRFWVVVHFHIKFQWLIWNCPLKNVRKASYQSTHLKLFSSVLCQIFLPSISGTPPGDHRLTTISKSFNVKCTHLPGTTYSNCMYAPNLDILFQHQGTAYPTLDSRYRYCIITTFFQVLMHFTCHNIIFIATTLYG